MFTVESEVVRLQSVVSGDLVQSVDQSAIQKFPKFEFCT
jgi:hypothetical protein